jgi:osmotically-inducible protein OsmY
MSRTRTGLVAAVSAGLGMIVAHLLDPDRGRARRAQLRDQLGATVRRSRRRTERRARYGIGALKGTAWKAIGAGRMHPEDDRDVVQGIKQRFARLGFPMSDVTVDVVDGTTTLRGQLDEPDQVDIVQNEVMKVAGVRAVESYLHLPGEPAPNKAAALHPVSS